MEGRTFVGLGRLRDRGERMRGSTCWMAFGGMGLGWGDGEGAVGREQSRVMLPR